MRMQALKAVEAGELPTGSISRCLKGNRGSHA